MVGEGRRYPHYPVWYVVTARGVQMPLNMFGLRHILRVDAGDMADMDTYYERFVRPLTVDNPTIEYQIYAREPENPFRDQAQQPSEEGERHGG